MESPIHNMSNLFDQLGLDNRDEAIERFVEHHKPVPPNLRLYEAEFWNEAQAAFLREAIDQDADWAELVDRLDAMMR